MNKCLIIFGIALLVVVILCIVPMLLLWSLNTMFEHSGAAIYIPHELWTYIPATVVIAMLRGK